MIPTTVNSMLMRTTGSLVWTRTLTLVVLVAAATLSETTIDARDNRLTFGTLARCDDVQCQWTDRNGDAVAADVMVSQFLHDEGILHDSSSAARRRLEAHVEYLETLHKLAAQRHWAFPYAMGVNSRHLHHDGDRTLSPAAFVQQEHEAAQRQRQRQRRLTARGHRLATSPPAYRETLNWCSPDNVRNESICTAVKSQNQCGSCWAFAAADSIETAVAVSAGTRPPSLSPQQFLACSARDMTATFDYCWAAGGVEGSRWLERQMVWGSRNDACNGGMTHAAFADAAQRQWSLQSELSFPYEERETRRTEASGSSGADKCTRSALDDAAASISGWQQVVGPSCDESSDPTELLKLALQHQPVSVAINSGGSFDAYKGGIYACPNDGTFASSAAINHALVLVGYGSDGATDYWILKNSYGASWGEKGFLRLQMDAKINCGLSVFAVVPTGARVGSVDTTVDGGGQVYFVGLTPECWIIVASVVAGATGLLTLVGAIYANRQRDAFKEAL